MHVFHVVYLWVMVVASCLSTLTYAILASKNQQPKPSTMSPFARFIAQLIGTSVFVFWALTLLGKI